MNSRFFGAIDSRRLVRLGDSLRRIAVTTVLLLASTAVSAQTMVAPQDEYKKLIKVDENIQPLGENPFGERINLYDGSISRGLSLSL